MPNISSFSLNLGGMIVAIWAMVITTPLPGWEWSFPALVGVQGLSLLVEMAYLRWQRHHFPLIGQAGDVVNGYANPILMSDIVSVSLQIETDGWFTSVRLPDGKLFVRGWQRRGPGIYVPLERGSFEDDGLADEVLDVLPDVNIAALSTYLFDGGTGYCHDANDQDQDDDGRSPRLE